MSDLTERVEDVAIIDHLIEELAVKHVALGQGGVGVTVRRALREMADKQRIICADAVAMSPAHATKKQIYELVIHAGVSNE